MHPIQFVALSIGLVFVCQKFITIWRALKSINNHPGRRLLIGPGALGTFLLPKIPGISPGRNSIFIEKFSAYEHYGWDIYSSVSFFPKFSVSLTLADAAAIKEVTTSRARFPKPVELYKSLSFYGPNIIATEGEDWKKHRKITAPAFSDRNNKMVWDEAVNIVSGLFKDVWADQKMVEVDHCLDVTLPIALFVIGAAGFGSRMSWKEDSLRTPGHELTFKEALHTVALNIILKAALPDWGFSLTKRLRDTRLAFDELGRYMAEMVQERLKSEKVERYDLFSSLLDSSVHDGTLTESELVGNIFIFLVAGHETTAHTLCFAFALLALHQDEQEALYQHIISVLSDGRPPSYEDMPLLTRCMAVFYETMRMFPPVNGIPKISAEDTTLVAGNRFGEKKTIPVPKGTELTLHTAGLHYNPRYWEDPHSFNPSRFLVKDWPRDAFLPFSAGARACVGRKFFETEGIAILTMLVLKYKITVKEEPQFAKETFQERKARILKAKAGITLTPVRVPLVFTRRS